MIGDDRAVEVSLRKQTSKRVITQGLGLTTRKRSFCAPTQRVILKLRAPVERIKLIGKVARLVVLILCHFVERVGYGGKPTQCVQLKERREASLVCHSGASVQCVITIGNTSAHATGHRRRKECHRLTV